MLFALLLTMMGVTSAMGQKIYQAELDKSMFAAWDGVGADAKQVEPTSYIGKEGATVNFACEMNLYKELSSGGMVFGNANVYSRWYADLTGTTTITFKGTSGVQLRVLMNRPDAEEGAADPNGGTTVERNVTIGNNGEVTLDVSDLDFVHLNAIKLGWGSSAGVVKSIVLTGTVKPVTGILSMINNGDAEGDDLESFPVSYDGPNNGETANERPEIVSGGVNGSKCFKVVSFPEPTTNWHTQFYVKSDEVLPKGTKWKLVMSIKADHDCTISTSAQAKPRAWKGSMGIDNFSVGTEWKEYSWKGEIGVDDFQSIAFDLNNPLEGETDYGNGSCGYFFDNIQFGIDLGEADPMNDLTFNFGVDVIRINLADNTNMKELVAAAGGKALIFPNCVTVTWNGKTCNITSIEGRPDGNLYIFLEDMDGEGGTDFEDDNAVVKVAFGNPAEAAYHLTFKEGKWAGEAVPDFSGMICQFDYDLGYSGDYFSYLWGTPEVVAADPENGSFRLPADTKEFLITFNQAVKAETVVAKLGKEALKATAADEDSKVIKLTRTANTALSGVVPLIISKALAAKSEYDLDEPVTLELSFGPFVVDPDDQPQELLGLTDWNETAEGGVPAGYAIWYQSETEPRVAGNTYGSGARMFAFGEGGDFTRGLYFREGYVLYGSLDDYKLSLKGGKKYKIHFNSAKWKSNGDALTFQIFSENDTENALFEENITPDPDVNGSKNAVNGSVASELSFEPEADGNYIFKWGVNGYKEVLLANPTVKYVPNVMGYEEISLLSTALENAKSVLAGNSGERYDGAALDALSATIAKYEAEGDAYTAPSKFKAAAAALDAAAQALKDHRLLCDTYDPLPEQAQKLVDANAEKKFAKTGIYATLKAVAAKYCEKKTETKVDEETGEEYQAEVFIAKLIKDDTELQAATTELKDAIQQAQINFTEGPSKVYSDWQGVVNEYGSGAYVLVERIRTGVETLKALGVAADDALIVAGNDALTDDDVLAENIQNRIKSIIYGDLKNAESQLFKTTIDPTTDEEVAPSYDMTVFIKNPNVYKQHASNAFTEENVPSWVTPEGYSKPGLSIGWGGSDYMYNMEIANDGMFQTWGGAYRVENTVANLPAGVYTLKAGFGERDHGDNGLDETFVYVKLSDTPEGEFAFTAECPEIGQSFPYSNVEITDIVVTDGTLTIGANAQAGTHTFFNNVELYMTGKADGFDYGKAYDEVMVGVEPTTKTAKVRAVQLFDLNGRRISTAKKGIVIIQKQMSDGTVKTEKVIK